MKHKNIALILISALLLLSGCNSDALTESKDEHLQSSEITSESESLSTENSKEDVVLHTIYGDYTGEPYVEVNGNVPFFTDDEKNSTEIFENYSELDSLGRCGVAYASICKELMPTEERGAIGSIKPTGWHTVKYNDIIDGNYLYNRCHLIGFQLAGENANKLNLITGTRYLNVIGMLPFENMIDDFVDLYDARVLYRVTPVYTGDNLLADGVLMEAYGAAGNEILEFNIFCFNVQPGIEIDYATGNSWESGDMPLEKEDTDIELTGTESTFIINTKTNKFHKESCGSAKTINEENKEVYIGIADELIIEGYEPCGKCHPEKDDSFSASLENIYYVQDKLYDLKQTQQFVNGSNDDKIYLTNDVLAELFVNGNINSFYYSNDGSFYYKYPSGTESSICVIN